MLTDNNDKRGFARHPNLTPEGESEEVEEIWDFLDSRGSRAKKGGSKKKPPK